MSIPDFKAAARRHYLDAQFLLGDRRWPNADHLAGVAAECGLKALMRRFFGVTLNQRNMPVWGQHSKNLGHVNHLWSELPLIVSGRAGPILTALIGGPSPFATWDVADRYSDDNAITEKGARDHFDKAREIVEILEQAELSGAVP